MLNLRKKALVTALGLALSAGGAQAGLKAVDPGPYTAATGFFPLFYTDDNDLTLDLCLSKAANANGLLCTLLPNPGVFDPLLPIVFPVNFPDEAFWFTADANVVGQGIDLLYVSAIEAAFAAGLPVPGDQISFSRIRLRADFDVTVPTPGIYRITHPFGVKEFSVAAPGRRVINDTVDIGIGAPGDFSGALGGQVGPFLVAAASPGGAPLPFIAAINPETGETEQFIGDPNVTQFVTGGQNGVNFVRIERIANLGGNPTGDISVTSDQFFLSGRVWNGQRPTNVAVDRASYSRTVDPVTLAVTTRIDGFATTPDSTTGSVCFRETLDLVAPGDPCLIDMTPDGAGKYFGQDSDAPRVPPYIVVTATDPTAATPTTPTPIAQPLGDLIKVSKATYAKNTGTLLIEATSSDEAAPPKITVVGVGVMTPIPGTIAGQRLQANLGVLGQAGSKEPPAFVTLVSSGGGRHTEPVTVVATAAVNRNPVAVDDSAPTAEDTAVNVNVLANDTDPDGDVLTVTGISGATNGTAAINANGTVRFTPAQNFNGTAGFNYAISDGKGGTASASVTVTVTPVNDNPVAVNDTATTAANTPVTINVLANDSDVDGDPLTVTALGPVTGGSAAIDAGSTTVTFTPNAGVTAGSFTYTVSDGDLSATATVNVNVQAGVDYNIASVSVPGNGRVGRALKPFTVRIAYVSGPVPVVPRTATLVGVQRGLTVYGPVPLQVSDNPGGGTSQFAFPAYTPTTTGDIIWTLTLVDDVPNTVTGTTAVPR